MSRKNKSSVAEILVATLAATTICSVAANAPELANKIKKTRKHSARHKANANACADRKWQPFYLKNNKSNKNDDVEATMDVESADSAEATADVKGADDIMATTDDKAVAVTESSLIVEDSAESEGEDSDSTERALKKQNRLLAGIFVMVAGMFLVAFVSAILIVPKVIVILDQTEATIGEVQTEIDNLREIESIVNDFSKVSKEIASADIPGLIGKTEGLVDESGDGIAKAVQKLDSIDIKSLNKAIEDLKSVVEPLADMFDR